MEITLKNLLTFLPLEKELRERLLSRLGSFSKDQLLALTKVCWQTFYQLVEDRAQEEMVKFLNGVAEGKAELRTAVYQEIEKKFYQEFMEKLRRGEELMVLSDVRQKIQQSFQSSFDKGRIQG